MATSYSHRYRPLLGQLEIRLLKLLPDTSDAEIQCELHHADLIQLPSYDALSYTWGDPNDTQILRLDGLAQMVTNSLAVALRHLRHLDSPRVLWVDAICINQADDAEKADQVSKMRRIFESASRVIIWLGLPADDSEAVVGLIKRVGKAVDDNGLSGLQTSAVNKLSGQKLIATQKQISELLDQLDNEFSANFPQFAYAAFAARPWWRRIWVAQELAVNKQEPLFVLGDDQFEYGLMENYVNFLHHFQANLSHRADKMFEQVFGSSPMTDEQHQRGTRSLEQLRALQDICTTTPIEIITGIRSRYHRSEAERPLTLYNILKHTIIQPGRDPILKDKLDFLATDERDRIYALLGLAKDPHVVSRIRIDYSKDWTAAKVYRATTQALLANGNLEILSITQNPLMQKAKGLPSWVCPWERKTCRMPWGDSTSVEHPFKAGGEFGPDDVVISDNDPDTVFINGIRIGVVESLSSEIGPGTRKALEESTHRNEDWRPILTFMDDTTRLCGEATKPSPCTLEDVARLLVGDHEHNDEPRTNTIARQGQPDQPEPEPTVTSPYPQRRRCDPDGTSALSRFQMAYEWTRLNLMLFRYNEAGGSIVLSDDDMELFRAEISRMLDLVPTFRTFWFQFDETMQRRSWLTDTGYVGLGPPMMAEEDVVVVFKGSPTPSIIRRNEEDGIWLLVGEAYVHGIMDGELIQRDDITVERFKLG